MKILSREKVFYVYLLVLVLLSILPINGTNSSLNNTYILDIRLDYFAHFIVLLPYFFLLNNRFKKFRNTLFVLSIAMIFASFTEAIQYLIPYRTFNINDLAANWIGILLSFMLFFVIGLKIINSHNN
jgi:VanZ family protein